MTRIADLAPQAVWSHFQTLCEIPRPSKHEGALRDYLKGWAELKGFETSVDATGNLLIRKGATPGMEGRKGVVLQGHLDMVCQANAGTAHDFFKDPVRPVLKDGWLVAEDTTLGADNGIGVALGLAALEADNLAHGPLEVLLTVDEEAGMGGALGLESGWLQGELLINIDTEEWGDFYLGCAGGVDVNVRTGYAREALPAGHVGASLAVRGLKGGHSGCDIHLERGNANKLMLRLIRELQADCGARVAYFRGGTARNALAREAEARISYPVAMHAAVEGRVAAYQALLRDEFAGVDDGVTVSVAPAEVSEVMAQADEKRVFAALHAAPHGVKRMSRKVEGVVETSNNLGVIVVEDGAVFANLMVRSLLESGTRMLADEIVDLFTLAAFDIEREGEYPGWAPNPGSALLDLFQRVYAREFGGEAGVKVIHAGLECGLIGARYPHMDMVSFGPDIRGAHAPGERVNVESVAHVWRLLQAVLADVPARG